MEALEDPGNGTGDGSNGNIDLENFRTVRKAVMEFVKSELSEGVDFGKSYAGADKDVLLKPGAEKIAILLRLEPVFIKDTDTFDMIGKPGRICMICFLVTHDAKVSALETLGKLGVEFREEVYRCFAYAEGRGAGNVHEKKNTTDNTLVKMVEKRAQVNATLRIASLSDIFTQDLEEMETGKEKAADDGFDDDIPWDDEPEKKKQKKSGKSKDSDIDAIFDEDPAPKKDPKKVFDELGMKKGSDLPPKKKGKSLTTEVRRMMEMQQATIMDFIEQNADMLDEATRTYYNELDIVAEKKWREDGTDPLQYMSRKFLVLKSKVDEIKASYTF